MQLFHRAYGEAGKTPIVILHGLFGSSDNWMTQARLLSEHFPVYTLDLRNHGLSPHDAASGYTEMMEDVREFIQSLGSGPVTLIGHSMGGKVAMKLAVTEPALVDKLVVVDIVPKKYTPHHDHIIEGLKAIPVERLGSRQEADEILSAHVPDAGVRQFLLKNLSRTGDGFNWKINLNDIVANMPEILDDPVGDGTYVGPTLFIMGSKSSYYQPSDDSRLTACFPNHVLRFLDTGHWVQAEQPQAFVNTVLDFLRS